MRSPWHRVGLAAKYAALTAFLLFAIVPLYWILVTSLKAPDALYAVPLQYWPRSASFENYRQLFEFADFGRYFRNSLGVTIFAAAGAMIVSLLAGYALSRWHAIKTRGRLLLALYFTQMVPPFILMIPLFTTLTRLGLTDKLWVLTVVYVATVVAFDTIMAKSFFDRVPSSLDDAAAIDGCTRMQLLTRVLLPVMLPGLAAIFSFSFVNVWNELFLAVILISTGDKMTVPPALNSFISKAGISWGVMSAGIIVALLPTMAVFAVGQRYIVSGLTQGSVKG